MFKLEIFKLPLKLLIIATLLSFGFWSATVEAQESIDGYWEGVIANQGSELRVYVEFANQPDGLKATIDIPDLYILGYKLSNVSLQASKVHFELPLGSQPDTFDGTFNGKVISGSYLGRFYQEEPRSASWRLWRGKREPLRYKKEEVTFQNGHIKLAGTLSVPPGKAKHPAVVLFHGSGPQTRESYLRFFADLFARHGIATLIYDKRGTGASTGEVWYKTGDQFDELAADALAGVQLLLKRPDIDQKRIGLWGFSQGGWLTPLAASRSKNISFLVVVSGGGVTPAEQEIYDDEVKLRDKGFSEEQIKEAVALLMLADDVIRKREPLDKFVAARDEAQKQPWFVHLDRYPVKLPKEHPTWQAGAGSLDLDPRLLWEGISIPVLAVFGEEDKLTPALESSRRIETALKKAGNRDYTIKVFPKADHGIWVLPQNAKLDWERPAPGWLKTMTDWLLERVALRK